MNTLDFLSKLICWSMLILTIAGTVYSLYVLLKASKEDDDFNRTGINTTAKIISIEETGRWAGNNPVAVITAEIIINGNQTQISTFTEPISPINAPAIQPGKSIRVRFLPENPDKVEIIW